MKSEHEKPNLGIGLVGCGFMARVHSHAWDQVGRHFDLSLLPATRAVASSNPGNAASFATQWGWESTALNVAELLGRDDIGLIDITAPNHVHAEIAIAAAEAGKAVACEKPLAISLQQAREMVEAVERAGVPNFVWFNYRRVPAIALAKKLIADGRIGRVFRVSCGYLQDWLVEPSAMDNWRLQRSCGGGVSVDLASHSIDMIRFLTGSEFTRVTAIARTMTRSDQQTADDLVEDSMAAIAELQNGATVTLEASRCGTGHQNSNSIEISGELGSIRYDLTDFGVLNLWDNQLPRNERGWRRISATGRSFEFADRYWPAEHAIGYAETFTNTAAAIMESLTPGGSSFSPNFRDALSCQEVLESLAVSAEQQRWVSVEEISSTCGEINS